MRTYFRKNRRSSGDAFTGGAAERERLDQLQKMGALVSTQARAIICPRCEAHSVRIMAAGSAFCVDSGPVSLSPRDVQRLMPDGDWLRRRMAQALDLAGEQAWMMVPGRLWQIGDIGRANATGCSTASS